MTSEKTEQFIKENSRGVIRPGLSRITELLRRLGDPQKKLHFVHAAGTNGKGSVCAMLESVLRCAGCRTGLYTSPHLERMNEEIRVNGTEIPDADLRELIGRVSRQAERMTDPPSRFETVTAAALLYFYECRCEMVILETGMGGTEDATNVIPAPELCIITNIGYDHTEYLGHTLKEIAAQKAGIIKPGSRVVCYDLPGEARDVISAVCRERAVQVRYADFSRLSVCAPEGERLQKFFYKGTGYAFSLSGRFQTRNAAVVLEAADALRDGGRNIPEAAAAEGLSRVRWPARFEILSRSPLIILDGGHNAQCAEAFADALGHLRPGRKWNLVLGMLRDKDYETVIRILKPFVRRFYCVTPESERALPAEELSEAVRKNGAQAAAFEDIRSGLEAAVGTGEACTAVFGSLSIAACTRKYFSHEGDLPCL